MDETNLSALKQILQMDTPLDFLINFIIIAIFAGFGEEMIFRGVIQKELSKTFSPTNSIIIAALLFSALHFEFTGFLPKFIIGLILGYAYFLTQNLLYPILMHTFNNGFQLLILYLSGSNLEQADTAAITTTSIVGALLFIPLIYLMLIHLNKYRINGSNS
jgi:membrane protease YdiL (CAAX protease family)